MELSPLLIYIIMQADSFITVAGTILFGAAVIGGVSGIFYLANIIDRREREDGQRILRRICRSACGMLAATILIVVLTPSTKTLVAMYSIPTALELAKDVNLDETALKAVRSVNKLLDGYLEEE